VKAAPVVYVFGEEAFLADRALAEIEQEALGPGGGELDREVFQAPEASPARVVAAARTLPFLAGRRLVLVRNAHLWSADAWQPILPYLEAPNPSTSLVFVAAELDRRTRAGKALEKLARLVPCRKPAERELPGWVGQLLREAGVQAPPEAAQTLVLKVGPDLQLLYREVEKLRVFAGNTGRITEADVQALTVETRGTTVFALCDAVGRRELAAARAQLQRLLQLGEAPPKLLYMIARHFRQLWAARELLAETRGRADAKSAAAALGVPPFAAEGLLRQARTWNEEELKGAFRGLLRADLALKTGAGRQALDRLILGFFSRSRSRGE
jgi:DNA polymerase III subunit delta